LPIEIWTAADLDNIRNDMSGNYILMADIDLIGFASWEPLVGPPDGFFSGTLDFNGFKVKNLTINVIAPTPSNVEYALFVGLNVGGSILNAALENVNIFINPSADPLIARGYCGASLVSTIWGGVISKGYATGNVTAPQAAGFVYQNMGGNITDCYSLCEVTCNGIENPEKAAGFLFNNLTLDNGGVIQNCYSVGKVNGAIRDVIFHPGGFCLFNQPKPVSIVNCFYDPEIAGWVDEDGNPGSGTPGQAHPKTAAEMKQQATYVNWDFVLPIWYIQEGISYPNFIKSEIVLTKMLCDGSYPGFHPPNVNIFCDGSKR
jgi:hypothetical protein